MRTLGLAVLLSATPALAQTTLKIATLAPEGSAWMNLFHEANKNIAARTGGRVKLKYFPGGVAGDEKDTIRKMRIGQLHGTAITSVGLGQIYPDLRVLELPFMFRSDAELDHVRAKLAPEFEKQLGERGYVLIGWGDVGWVHLFTGAPVQSLDDLKKIKMWAWVDDPLVRNLFKGLGINGIPLGLPEVLPSLQTGLINGAYGSPLSTLALQWHSKLKYMNDMKVSYAVGGAILSRKTFDALSPEDQKTLKEEGAKLQTKLIAQIRKDNAEALAALRRGGLQVMTTPPAMQQQFEKQAQNLWQTAAGTIYPRDLLEKVKALVAEYRAQGGR